MLREIQLRVFRDGRNLKFTDISGIFQLQIIL
jgi:hypothetical protein